MSKAKPIVVPEKLCKGMLYNGKYFCSWGYLINKVLRVPKKDLLNKVTPDWYRGHLYTTLEKRYNLKRVSFRSMMTDNDEADSIFIFIFILIILFSPFSCSFEMKAPEINKVDNKNDEPYQVIDNGETKEYIFKKDIDGEIQTITVTGEGVSVVVNK